MQINKTPSRLTMRAVADPVRLKTTGRKPYCEHAVYLPLATLAAARSRFMSTHPKPITRVAATPADELRF